jgi:hypothetical protein
VAAQLVASQVVLSSTELVHSHPESAQYVLALCGEGFLALLQHSLACRSPTIIHT